MLKYEYVCRLFFQKTGKVHEKGASPAYSIPNLASVFPTPFTLGLYQECFTRTSHFLRLLRRHILKGWDLIKLMFTASSRDVLKGSQHFLKKLKCPNVKNTMVSCIVWGQCLILTKFYPPWLFYPPSVQIQHRKNVIPSYYKEFDLVAFQKEPRGPLQGSTDCALRTDTLENRFRVHVPGLAGKEWMLRGGTHNIIRESIPWLLSGNTAREHVQESLSFAVGGNP